MADRTFQKTQTSTQIRNLYSEGMSYLNIRFFNTNLSFQFSPFVKKDQNGRSRYNIKASQQTTVNYDGAYALWKLGTDILNGTVQEGSITIPCSNDAMLRLERKMTQNGPATFFSIRKNNNTIDFKFSTMTVELKENGQPVQKVLETQLGVFVKTLEGYLTGINADRHLDKLTDDFAKLQEVQNGQNGSSWNNQNNNSYQRRPYQPNGSNQSSNQWGAPPQSMDQYSLPN